MAQDPYNFDFNLSGNTPPAPSDHRRYIAPPFDARILSDTEASLLVSRQAEPARLSITAARILGACDRFRTLDEQARQAINQLRASPTQASEFARELKQLAERGLLLSQSDLLKRLQDWNPSDHRSRHIETLFVRTCNRPQTLARLLDSVARLTDPNDLKQCIVLDDSNSDGGDPRTIEVVHEYRGRLPLELHHIGRAQRRAILEKIAAESEADAADLRWFVEGDSGDDQPTYGAGLNLALLLAAGKTFTIMDDDASLAAFRLHETDTRHRFAATPSARLAFPEPETELSAGFEPLATTPLAEHARYLGCTGAEFAIHGKEDLDALFERVDPQLLFELAAPTRIRITTNGTLGDPGTSGIQWLFTESNENLAALCSDEQRYRQLVGQRRTARSPDSIQATTAFSLMTTTLTGIDNRELLLPTQARGGNEDLLFGALVTWLHPGSLHAALPHMLLHERPEPRRWQAEDIDRPRSTNRGRFLADHLERLAAGLPAGGVGSRIKLLRGWLEGLADSPVDELRWRLQQDMLKLRGETVERTRARLVELKPPPWLEADFRRSLAAHARDHALDRTRIETMTQDIPRFARRYAAGLDSWCRAWRLASSQPLGHLIRADFRGARP
jgi:hypothetical protein